MASARPQLNLDELHQLKWLLGGVLALFSAWTIIYIDDTALPLLILLTLAVAVVVVRPSLPGLIPAWLNRIAVPGIILAFLIDLWLGEALPAMMRLDLLLIFYRVVTYRQRREDLQLIMLGLFMVAVTGVLTVSLEFAVQILIFTACALAYLFVINLVEAAEAKYPPERVPLFRWTQSLETPAWTRHADWRRLFRRLRQAGDWRLVGWGIPLFGLLVGVSALLFVSIPRFQLQNSFFLDRFISRQTQTGFSESIRFGDVTDIIADNSLALSVDFRGPEQVPGTIYLRMVVLDEYGGGGFRMSDTLQRSYPFEQADPFDVQGTEPPRRGERSIWTFYFEPGVSRYLPIPGSFERLQLQDYQRVDNNPFLRLVRLRNEPVAMQAYRMDRIDLSGVLPDPGFSRRMAQGDLLTPEELLLGLRLEPDERATLQGLVDEIAGAATGPGQMSASEFSRRAASWLEERHSYSLQSELPFGFSDPLVRWIGSEADGHCEFFAGAFVLLAREAGYPARLISGFRGGTWNAFTGTLSVRNSDAHAWTEIWDDSIGAWLRVDPTPGAEVVAGTNLAAGTGLDRFLDRSWAARVDSLRILWYRRVVNFDQQDQLSTLGSLRDATTAASDRLRAWINGWSSRTREWLSSPWGVGRLTRVLGSGIALAIFGVLLVQAVRSWRWRPRDGSRPGRLDPVRREAGRWLQRLRGDAGRVAQVAGFPEAQAELERLRYGPRESWPEPLRTFRRARQVWRERRKGN